MEGKQENIRKTRMSLKWWEWYYLLFPGASSVPSMVDSTISSTSRSNATTPAASAPECKVASSSTCTSAPGTATDGSISLNVSISTTTNSTSEYHTHERLQSTSQLSEKNSIVSLCYDCCAQQQQPSTSATAVAGVTQQAQQKRNTSLTDQQQTTSGSGGGSGGTKGEGSGGGAASASSMISPFPFHTLNVHLLRGRNLVAKDACGKKWEVYRVELLCTLKDVIRLIAP